MTVLFQFNCTGGWIDYSDGVDLTKLTRELSLDVDNDPQKSITGTISLSGGAYTDVYNHLVNNVNMYSNSVCVRVIDTVCSGDEYYFKIDNKNLRWCDTDGCEMEFDMTGYEPQLDCIRNTTIADNTNNVFDQFGSIVHPRFRYCDVIKPTLFFGFIMALASLVDAILIGWNGAINALNSVLGLGLTPIGYLGNTLSGCQRGWPSPFIRTYISNVCTLCGMSADETTAPVFYDVKNPFAPAEDNPYYYAALLTAYTKKGVRMNGTQSYIPNNAPSWTLRRMLKEIKPLWNARWFLYNNMVYFHRKDLIGELIWGTTPAIDFTTGNDSGFLIDGVCYEWNGEGKVRRLYMHYAKDQTDAIGNEVANRFNGEYLDTSGNDNYTEAKDVSVEEISTASFVLDGNDADYDSILLLSIASLFGPLGVAGALKSTTDTCSLAKVICYDPATPITDARSISNPLTIYQLLTSFFDDNTNAGLITSAISKNYNYPMAFDPSANPYGKNLWQYHQIDVPSPDKKTNIRFSFKMQYCCDYSGLNLYQRIKFKDGNLGEVNFVQFNHEERSITIKGNLL